MREVTVLIGELSHRTGVSTRLLRYYEEQGLLEPGRDAKGYRTYVAHAPELVGRIRALLDAGLSTAEIRELLPCQTTTGMQHCDHSRKVLQEGLARLDHEITELARRRALLAGHQDPAMQR